MKAKQNANFFKDTAFSNLLMILDSEMKHLQRKGHGSNDTRQTTYVRRGDTVEKWTTE